MTSFDPNPGRTLITQSHGDAGRGVPLAGGAGGVDERGSLLLLEEEEELELEAVVVAVCDDPVRACF